MRLCNEECVGEGAPPMRTSAGKGVWLKWTNADHVGGRGVKNAIFMRTSMHDPILVLLRPSSLKYYFRASITCMCI